VQDTADVIGRPHISDEAGGDPGGFGASDVAMATALVYSEYPATLVGLLNEPLVGDRYLLPTLHGC
jgi:hypothetical protein